MTAMTSECSKPTAIEYRLGSILSIPLGEGRQFVVEGREIAIFHARNGTVYATQALCPHQAGPLADGLLGGSTLVCPLHAMRFDLATGDALNGGCGLITYKVRTTVTGEIVLTLDSQPQSSRQ